MIFSTNDVIRNRYVVISTLGRGASGTVYEVKDKTDETIKAAKCVRLNNGNDTASMTEIAILNRLDLVDGVIKIHAYFALDGFFWTVTPVYEFDLADLVNNQTFSPALTCKVAVKLYRILQEVHLYGVIHRDLKASNVMVKGPHENIQLVLIDFGMATRFKMPSGRRMSTMPAADYNYAGCDYSSVRLAQGLRASEVDDVYMVGYLILELRGLQPFSGATPQEMTNKKLAFHSDPSVVLNASNHFLREPLNRICRQRADWTPDYKGIRTSFKRAVKYDVAAPLKLKEGQDGIVYLSF